MSGSDTTPDSPAPSMVPGGLRDDPGGLQDGEFGLGGDIRQQMIDALSQSFADTDTPDEDPAPAPDPSAPTEDGGGAGGDAGVPTAATDGAGDPPASSPPSSPSEDFDFNAYARDYFGTQLDRDQARELFGIIGGLQSLTPAQRADLDRILSSPAQPYPATTGTPAQPSPSIPPTAPDSPPIPGLPPRPSDEYEAQIYDRMLLPYAQQIHNELSNLRGEVTSLTTHQQSVARATVEAEIDAASRSWREEHPDLTDPEYDSLVDSVVRSGIFPSLHASTRSATNATRAALDQIFWANPTFRERALANAASGRLPTNSSLPDPASPVAQSQASDDAHRQARAGSVSGSGGAATPRGNASAPTTPEGRRDAMLAELAANMQTD